MFWFCAFSGKTEIPRELSTSPETSTLTQSSLATKFGYLYFSASGMLSQVVSKNKMKRVLKACGNYGFPSGLALEIAVWSRGLRSKFLSTSPSSCEDAIRWESGKGCPKGNFLGSVRNMRLLGTR